MFTFLQSLDKDLQQTLLNQLRDLWTHTSTAIEGNTLSLGDTKFILEEGLTVSGKPIKDHQEVIGHAKAIEIIYSMLGRNITENDLYDLHKAVQSEKITDIYKPYGAWKNEPNGTYAINEQGRQVFVEYAHPSDVQSLMAEILDFINQISASKVAIEQVPNIYAKIHMGIVHTHPFWDGNGRVARLVANIPALNSGNPPIIIANENRKSYIEILAKYQNQVDQISAKTGVWPQPEKLNGFDEFCKESYKSTKLLVKNAHQQQAIRDENY